MLYIGEGILACYLLDVISDTVLVIIGYLLKGHILTLYSEYKGNTGIDHSLFLHYVLKVLLLDAYLGEYIEVGLPAGACTCLFGGIFFLFKTAYVVTLFKVKVVFKSVTYYLYIHIFRGILCSAGTQSVKTQCVLIVIA